MKKLNNKGYMLVEIILASVIAFGVAYFIIDLTLKLKNRNDDLLVETLVSTDQAIIMNKIMAEARNNSEEFSCDNLTHDGNKIMYNGEVIDEVTKYATVGDIFCDYTDEELSISIPLDVKQLKGKDFNVKLAYIPNASINASSSSTPSDSYRIVTETCQGYPATGGYCQYNGATYYNDYCYYKVEGVSYDSNCTEVAAYMTCGPHSLYQQNVKCYLQ